MRIPAEIFTIALVSFLLGTLAGWIAYHVLLHTRFERRRGRQVELLNFITRTALETANLREMLQQLAGQLSQWMEADGIYIAIWDPARGRSIPAAASGALRDLYAGLAFEPDEPSLSRAVLEAGHALVIKDVFDTPDWDRRIAGPFPGRAALGLPLVTNDQKLGAVIVSFNRRHRFRAQEIPHWEQAAAHIALAVSKAQLLDAGERRVAQLGLLEEVSRQIANSLDEDEIIQRTVKAVIERFGFIEAALMVPAGDQELELIAISGTENMGFHPGFRQKIGTGIVGHAAETRTTYVSGDVARDPYYFSNRERNGSAVGIPMLHEEQLIGVLYVEDTALNAFQPQDVQTLQTLSSHVATSIQKARLYARVRDQLRALTALQSISQTITSSLDLVAIFETVIQLLKDSFGYNHVSIYLLDGEVLHLGAEVGYPEAKVIREIPISSGVIGRTAQTQTAQFVRDVSRDPAYLEASKVIDSEICVPLLKEGTVLGVINVEATRARPLGEGDLELLTALAGPVAVAIDNARLHAEVKSLAMTDSLTGLMNRRAFDQVFETEFARAARYIHPLGLIVLDLDSFKEFNDARGHPAGDERLKEIARLIQLNLRDPDVAARIGGDEFAILLPDTSKSGTLILAERLRRAAEAEAPQRTQDRRPIAGYTISLGAAAFPEDRDTPRALMLAADDSQLAAKQLGKNCVRTLDEADKK